MVTCPEITRSHCNRCARETKHIVLASRKVDDSEELGDVGQIEFWDKYELVECCGCENVTMRHTSYFEPTNRTITITYPPQVLRRRPHWLSELPAGIVGLMHEIYQALDSNSRTLTLMGARAAVDMVLTDKVGDAGTFSNKLDALEDTGVIGSRNRTFLEAALDAGSAATHRGYQPSADDVSAVMDVVENLLQAAYHLNSLAERLKKTTPRRDANRKRK